MNAGRASWRHRAHPRHARRRPARGDRRLGGRRARATLPASRRRPGTV